MEYGGSSRIMALVALLSYIASLGPVAVYAEAPRDDSVAVASSSGWVSPEEGGAIELDGVRVVVPAGAVKKLTRIRISRLSVIEVLDEGMSNATTGAAGYRFEPHGTRFELPTRIVMPFDRKLLGSETALSNLRTYFYDEEAEAWEALERENIDRQEAAVVSMTSHFTDMVNSTLQLPEGPAPIQFDPNSIKNLEAADPSNGVAKLEASGGSPQGGLSFSIPLRLPAGRAGMSPELALRYSSEGGNGLLGRSFDIDFPEITIDTRFGMPKYDGEDRYMLDGEQLLYAGSDAGERLYKPRVEKAFLRIRWIRDGVAGDYWEVTEKSGAVRIYGTEDAWTGPDRADRTKTFAWYLSEVRDAFGNTITYTYEYDGVDRYAYPKRIEYTGHTNGTEGAFSVVFDYESRLDAHIDARGKFASTLGRRMTKIAVSYRERPVRSFVFDYRTNLHGESLNELGQSQLSFFAEQDASGTEFYRYPFSYSELDATLGDQEEFLGYTLFGKEEHWGAYDGNAGIKNINKVTSISGGVSLYAGVHVSIWIPFIGRKTLASIGARGSYSLTSGQAVETLADIDGDGRPDMIFRDADGSLVAYLNKGIGKGFDTNIGYRAMAFDTKINKEKSSSWSVGASVTFGPVSGGITWQWGSSDAVGGFADIDGDGRVDYIVAGKTHYFRNNGSGFDVVDFDVRADTPDAGADPKEEEYDRSYYVQEALRKWESYIDGTVIVRQSARLLDGANASNDGVALRAYARGVADPLSEILLTRSAISAVGQSFDTPVGKDGALYFHQDVGSDERGDSTEWPIHIQYASARYFSGIQYGVPLEPPPASTLALPWNDQRFATIYNPPTVEGETQYTLKSGWRSSDTATLRSICEAIADHGYFVPTRVPRSVYEVIKERSYWKGQTAITIDYDTTMYEGGAKQQIASANTLFVSCYAYDREMDAFIRYDGDAKLFDARSKLVPILRFALEDAAGGGALSSDELRSMAFGNPYPGRFMPLQSSDGSLVDTAAPESFPATIQAGRRSGNESDELGYYIASVPYGAGGSDDTVWLKKNGTVWTLRKVGDDGILDITESLVQVDEAPCSIAVTFIDRGVERMVRLGGKTSALTQVSTLVFDEAIVPHVLGDRAFNPDGMDRLPEAAMGALLYLCSPAQTATLDDLYTLDGESGTYRLRTDATKEELGSAAAIVFEYRDESDVFSVLPGGDAGDRRILGLDEAGYASFVGFAGSDFGQLFDSYLVVGAFGPHTEYYQRPGLDSGDNSRLGAMMALYALEVVLFPYFDAEDEDAIRYLRAGIEPSAIAEDLLATGVWTFTVREERLRYRKDSMVPIVPGAFPEGGSLDPLFKSYGEPYQSGRSAGILSYPVIVDGAVATARAYFPEFDSGLDYSEVEAPDEPEYAEQSSDVSEPFGGGVKNWYYGFWIGYYDWDQSKLNADPNAELSGEEAILPPFALSASANKDDEDNAVVANEGAAGTALSLAARIGSASTVSMENDNGDGLATLHYSPYIIGDTLMPERKGGDTYWTMPRAGGAGVHGGIISAIRASKSSSQDINGGAGIGALGASLGKNTGDSWQYAGLLDVNGDRYPDYVSLPDGESGGSTMTVLRGTGGGLGESSTISLPYRHISKYHNESLSFGASLGSNGGGQKPEYSAYGGIKSIQIVEPAPPSGPGGSIGYNGTFGYSNQTIGLMDMNGDGLVDQVNRDGSGSYQVALNLGGTSFSDSIPWGSAASPASGYFDETIKGMNYSLTSSFGSTLGGQFGPVSVSAGFNATQNRTLSGLYDVNGDGLSDQVIKLDGDDYFRVRLNRGNGFSEQELKFYRPDWDDLDPDSLSESVRGDLGTIQTSLDLDLPQGKVKPEFSSMAENNGNNEFGDSGDPLRINDVLSASSGASFNLAGSLTLKWGFLVAFVTTLGVNGSVSTTKSSLTFSDIDGDGLPDHIIKLPTENYFRVKRNLAGEAGLMEIVTLPQGGFYEFGYTRDGNTPDMPQSTWTVTSIVRSTGDLPADRGITEYREDFEYADGNYDRMERQFMGFGSVTTKKPNGTRTVASFVVRNNYYAKGMPLGSTTEDSTGRTLAWSQNALAFSDSTDLHYGGISRFYYVSSETSRTYDPATKDYMERKIEYAYDRYGNVTELDDSGDTARTGDELYARFTYDHSKDHYLKQLPTRIIVTDANGTSLRKREGNYGDYGELMSLRQYYEDTRASESKLSWDETYGNLLSISDPRGARVSWTYEQTDHAYVEQIRQDNPTLGGPAYVSLMTWDHALGLMRSKTDPNQQTMDYDYDTFGRLRSVTSPYDVPGNPAVRYDYITEGFPWTAVTSNKVSYDPVDTTVIRTALAVDGLGRSLQTAKDGECREGEARRYGWNISGAVTYDRAGRPVAEGQSRFVDGRDTLPAPGSMLRPTLKDYDELDRVVRVELPDSPAPAVMTTRYGIADGTSYELSTDPLGNMSEKRMDARGNVVKVQRINGAGTVLSSASYEYDAMGQMLRALDHRGTPIGVSYDMLGRRTRLSSPDSGIVETVYDTSGNPVRKIDSVLRSRGESIQYAYDGLNRLVEIDYPRSDDVTYTYGGSEAASDNGAGRLLRRVDESGTTNFAYGLLGETVRMERSITRLKSYADPESSVFEYAGDYLGRMEQIIYPDDEIVSYGYDSGGHIKSVKGNHYNQETTYVADIAYDAFGQRIYIEYGNGTRTSYEYDQNRRWLDTIHTSSGAGTALQSMDYSIDAVGNVLGYSNEALTYTTNQHYEYDDLYQLVDAQGNTVSRAYGLEDYRSVYHQIFAFDDIGNMTRKASTSTTTPRQTIGQDLNHTLDYAYYAGNSHQAERIGDIWYRYDQNGNVSEARQGGHSNSSSTGGQVVAQGDVRWTSQGFGLDRGGNQAEEAVWARYYSWDEENRLKRSVEGELSVEYRYGADGQRALKYSKRGESLYFDAMWSVSIAGTDIRQSKHVYVGQTRVATRLNYMDKTDTGFENVNTYYYHSDHLGSAQLVTDPSGDEYEHIEYTPYGELWVEKTREGIDAIPFRFTSKELDPETGLYYYGARYLDPKTSVWLSADPALGEYVPGAPIDEEARKRNGNLPGMGGVFNTVNLHLYHYAGNNPIKYTDTDGNEIVSYSVKDRMTNYAPQVKLGKSTTINFRKEGCYVTALGNALGTKVSQSYQGGFGAGLSFMQSMRLNNNKDLFVADSASLKIREVSMDAIFGKGNWDYWTKGGSGTDVMLSKLKEYADSGKKFIIVGIFNLSSANPDVKNHMVGIQGLPGSDGIFSPDMIVPSSQGDADRLGNTEQRKAYSMENLNEIRVIFLGGDL